MSISRLREFVRDVTHIVGDAHAEAVTLEKIREPMARLIETDDWLPDEYAKPDSQYYQQYLLHCDSLERFSMVSFVWGPGQGTPIHNHTVWGMIGMLRGAEVATGFTRDPASEMLRPGAPVTLRAGDIEVVSPTVGDIHQVRNFYSDRVSISIHVYGGNIGRLDRNVFDPETGVKKSFVSGFSSKHMPNLWSN